MNNEITIEVLARAIDATQKTVQSNNNDDEI
ncbi:hypothetical protein IGI58_001155 [Enterococcus sp. AZ020]